MIIPSSNQLTVNMTLQGRHDISELTDNATVFFKLFIKDDINETSKLRITGSLREKHR